MHINKTPLLLLFGLLWVFPVSSQVILGPQVGVHAYTVHFDTEENQDRFSSSIKPGFSVGFFLNAPLSNQYSLQTEFHYSLKGRKVLSNSDTWENNLIYHFIELPVLLRRSFNLNIGDQTLSGFFVNVGPNFSYWLPGGSAQLTTPGLVLDYSFSFDDNGVSTVDETYYTDINRFQLGLDFGLGYSVEIQRERYLTTEVRFSLGGTFLGSDDSSTLTILGYEDSLRSNYRLLSLSVSYGWEFDPRNRKRGGSIKR